MTVEYIITIKSKQLNREKFTDLFGKIKSLNFKIDGFRIFNNKNYDSEDIETNEKVFLKYPDSLHSLCFSLFLDENHPRHKLDYIEPMITFSAGYMIIDIEDFLIREGVNQSMSYFLSEMADFFSTMPHKASFNLDHKKVFSGKLGKDFLDKFNSYIEDARKEGYL